MSFKDSNQTKALISSLLNSFHGMFAADHSNHVRGTERPVPVAVHEGCQISFLIGLGGGSWCHCGEQEYGAFR